MDRRNDVETVDSEALHYHWGEQVSVGQSHARYWQGILKIPPDSEHMLDEQSARI